MHLTCTCNGCKPVTVMQSLERYVTMLAILIIIANIYNYPVNCFDKTCPIFSVYLRDIVPNLYHVTILQAIRSFIYVHIILPIAVHHVHMHIMRISMHIWLCKYCLSMCITDAIIICTLKIRMYVCLYVYSMYVAMYV